MPSSLFELVENAIIPNHGYEGYDISAVKKTIIPSHDHAIISTGMSIYVPNGIYGRIVPPSGLAHNHCIVILACVIDRDYNPQGEVKVILYNTSDHDFVIRSGDRIAQLILERIETQDFAVVLELEDDGRGVKRFEKVVDEGHLIRNRRSKRFGALNRIKARIKRILNGTFVKLLLGTW